MKRDLPTYYGQPAVKPSPYSWKIALYMVLAGMAGAGQLLAAVLNRDPWRKRRARLIGASVGAIAGPGLLIADLHTPDRFYNMLRIFRRTSPMSIGSYVLSAFGATSALTLTPAARFAQMPAAVAGAGMMTYTAPLLASTATPLWASAPRLLGAEFACSAMACGAAALSLDRVACAATVGNLAAVAGSSAVRTRQGTDTAFRKTGWGVAHKIGLGLSIALPLACYALNAVQGRSARRSGVAAAGILAGTFLSRWALLEAGNASARNPQDYFRLASDERTPAP